MNNILYTLLMKVQGSGLKTYDLLQKKEKISAKDIKELPNNGYTLLDDEYPQFMKMYYKPSFILIKEGDKGFVPYGENLSQKFEVRGDNEHLNEKLEREYLDNLEKYCA